MTSNLTTQPKAGHFPTLLVQWEPGYRVFLGNLAYTLLFRWTSRLPTATSSAPFWNDVFVPRGVGWGAFLESMLWHALALLALWTLSQPSLQPTPRRLDKFQASYLGYYKSSLSFPARGSSPRDVSQHSAAGHSSGGKSTIAVVPERGRDVISPPDMSLSRVGGRPEIALANSALPMMPLSATRHSQLTLPPSQDWVVAPAPAVDQGSSRWTGLTQVSVVGPPPTVAAGSARAGIAPPGLAVVAPPPNVQRGNVRIGDITIGRSEVVAPAPQLPMHEQNAIPGIAQGTLGNASVVPPPPSSAGLGRYGNGRGAVLARAGLPVVPPPPALQGMGSSAGKGGATAWSNAGGSVFPRSGLAVVPPPPTVGDVGNAGGVGPGNTLSRAGFSVVPPPPALQSFGGSVGGARGSGTTLSGTGLPVVPPPPAIPALAGSSAGGRGNSLSGAGPGAGFSVVPPPPALQGMGSSLGNGRGNGRTPAGFSAANNTSGAGDPAASGPGTGNAVPGERLMAMDVHPPVTPLPPLPPLVAKNPRGPAEELSLRVIGSALALPNSSYFSNYEVYFAERWLGKGEKELIKLVYEFLPYQQRLSEYPLNSRIYKVRVRRDPSCDESQWQMIWPEGESHAQPQANEGPVSAHSRRNDILSCYRTTADEYRRAVSRPATVRVDNKPGS